MTDAELAMIQRWNASDEGKAEIGITSLDVILSDIGDAIKTREGAHSARKNLSTLMAARKKFDDLIFDLSFAAAAE